jgi:hypothetical protein
VRKKRAAALGRCDIRSKQQAKTSAVLEAPIGHRQPSMGDLPPSLRQKEETGFERSGPPQVREPATHVRQRPGKPDDRELYEAPPTDISPICRGC